MTVLDDAPATPAPTLEIGAVELPPAPQWPAPPVASGQGAEATGGSTLPQEPVHCGRPMAVRRLDPLVPDSRANRAVLEAALAEERVHACACGYLLTLPAAPGRAEPLCAPHERAVFTELLLQRVHAAAGVVESVLWACDQLSPQEGGTDDPSEQWLLEADRESAAWAADTAELDLEAAVRLAAEHGVPAERLAEATGREAPQAA